jgi:hypothetical protein
MATLRSKLIFSIYVNGWLVSAVGHGLVIEQIPIPLASLLIQIDQAMKVNLYYAAVAIALTIPDICASLEADPDNGYWATEAKYVKWFDDNARKHFPEQFDGSDCYHLRGGVVRAGLANSDSSMSGFSA